MKLHDTHFYKIQDQDKIACHTNQNTTQLRSYNLVKIQKCKNDYLETVTINLHGHNCN